MRPLNRILTDTDRIMYGFAMRHMEMSCPEMMSRKIPSANVQQAFVYLAVRSALLSKETASVLCVGSFEDTACATLKADGIQVLEIDPDVNGMDLHKFFSSTTKKFDVIFSTSVIEHVKNDEQFIAEICQLLAPGGQAILTTDFKEDYRKGDPLPYSDERFYTTKDLTVRIPGILSKYGCKILGEQDYSGIDTFVYQGHHYSFATFVFRKSENV